MPFYINFAIEGNFKVYYPNGSIGHYNLKTDLEWLLTSYEDVNGNIMEYSYIENKGRYYNPTTFLLEKETAITSQNNTVTYAYDEYYRIIKTVEDHSDASFTTEVSYDAYGSIASEKKTTVLKHGNLTSTALIGYQYETSSGLLEKVLDDKGDTLYHITDLNEREQLMGAVYGNGIKVTNTWNKFGYLVAAKENSENVTALDYEYQFDSVLGNLKQRSNYAFESPIEETFSYDILDRLTRIRKEGKITQGLYYSNSGKIQDNSLVGSYNYQNQGKSFVLDQIHINDKGKTLFENRTLQKVTFTSFKKPLLITEKDNGSVAFEYNGVLTRSKAEFKNENDQITKIKWYNRDASCEIVVPNGGKDIQLISYIGGAYGSNISYISTFTNEGVLKKAAYYFLHRDYLGSLVAISDPNGTILEKRHYGAWGKLEQYESNSSELTADNPLLDRGWTGHEHLNKVHLVHMNGRLYDADLNRMLSPDNYVQDASNTQNFNRYQYGFNNPLKWTDPSGEIGLAAVMGIGALIGGFSYLINAAFEGNFSWGDFFKSAAIGAFAGGISFGIGSAFLGATGTILTNSLQVASHAASGGFFYALDSGSINQFWKGALIGGISAVISKSTLALISEKASAFVKAGVTNLVGMLSGGVGSILSGGSFWRGARQGMITSLLNHTVHDLIKGLHNAKVKKS